MHNFKQRGWQLSWVSGLLKSPKRIPIRWIKTDRYPPHYGMTISPLLFSIGITERNLSLDTYHYVTYFSQDKLIIYTGSFFFLSDCSTRRIAWKTHDHWNDTTVLSSKGSFRKYLGDFNLNFHDNESQRLKYFKRKHPGTPISPIICADTIWGLTLWSMDKHGIINFIDRVF